MKAILLLAFALNAHADWLEQERPIAIQKLRANISPADTKPGTVVASPLRRDPDYYFHWVRDAGLVMQGAMDLLASGQDVEAYSRMFEDYIRLSREQQGSNAITGLGEPKFNPDGSPYMGSWGRPQNDGPALRAIAIMRYARWRGVGDLYGNGSVIKTDLEYVAHNWRHASFDLWEEVLGDHFYTRMVQRRALIEGAELARAQNDGGAADFYLAQASELSREIEKHWDANRGYVTATLNRVGGLDYKDSGLDVAVILGVLHGHVDDTFFGFDDPRVIATAQRLVQAFRPLYAINAEGPGVAIGRYPEDRYAGATFDGGNPWPLATLAIAELDFRRGRLEEGDRFVERVRRHAYPDGSLSEQMRKDNGYMTSATDLTWNYAAVLSAWRARRGF